MPVFESLELDGLVPLHTDIRSMDSAPVQHSHNMDYILLPDPDVGMGKWMVAVVVVAPPLPVILDVGVVQWKTGPLP